MNEQINNRINANLALRSKLPQIIELFVSYYGEDDRERITNKLQNSLLIGYSKPEEKKDIIMLSIKEISEQAEKKFLDQLTQNNMVQVKLKKLFLNNYGFDSSPDLHPINQYIKYKKNPESHQEIKPQVVEFLSKIDKTITIENLDQYIDENKFEILDNIIPSYESALQEYNTNKNQLKPYIKEIIVNEELKKELEKKYTQKYIDSLKEIFQEEKYKQFNELPDDVKLQNCLLISIKYDTLIESFSEENEQMLQKGYSWQIGSILTDRIIYFKNLGLDLGDNYQNYQNYSEIDKYIPPKELVEKVSKIRKEFLKQMDKNYSSSIKEYQENIQTIKELDFLDEWGIYDTTRYTKGGTYIAPNLRFVNNQYIGYPILYLEISKEDDDIDHRLIHECNHIIEFSVTEVTETKYKTISGWDRIDLRTYEAFNESINELITLEILEIAKDVNFTIFDSPNQEIESNVTDYQHTFFISKPFYQTYKREIIESRKNGNMEIIYNAVGKENFEEFNQLFIEFTETFPGLDVYQLYQEMLNNENTEQTIKYQELIQRRDTLLAKMEEYHKHKDNTR